VSSFLFQLRHSFGLKSDPTPSVVAANRLESNDLERQQTVFKLIANELKSNTTKVLQSEMRTNVLPALVEVTRSEVRALVQAEIASGLKEAMTSVSFQSLYISSCDAG
jgi:hypothetical protein